MGGTLKDGVKSQGQYCVFVRDCCGDERWNFEEAKAKCESLSGSLPLLKTLTAQTKYFSHTCSDLDPNHAGTTKCTAVSNLK